VASGHRPIFGCVHNTRSSTVAALLRSPALPLTSQVTNSGWSINRQLYVALNGANAISQQPPRRHAVYGMEQARRASKAASSIAQVQ
jgi:hypothetical protein